MNTITTIIETGTVTYDQAVTVGCLFATVYAGAYFVSWLSGQVWCWIDDISANVFVHHPLLMLNLKVFNIGKLEYDTCMHWKQMGVSWGNSDYKGTMLPACTFLWPGALLFLLLPLTTLLVVNNLAVVGVAVLAVGTIWLARTARRTQKTLKSHMEDLAVHKKTK